MALEVNALAKGLDGTLYAGGRFTTAGGVAANYVAGWSSATSSWHALGSGPGSEGRYVHVDALAIGPDGSLYAGVDFTTADNVEVSSIAKWDGNSWSTLGNGRTTTAPSVPWRWTAVAAYTPGAGSPPPVAYRPTTLPAGTARPRHGTPWVAG